MTERITIITPSGISYKIGHIWNYREFFYFLIWRELKSRYKQTAIGILWVILSPIITMVIFSIIFGQISGVKDQNIPYPLFVYSGLLMWNFFSRSIITATESLVANQSIIKKISIPIVLLPISAVVVNLVDFLFAALVLFCLMIFYHFPFRFVGILIFLPAILGTFLLSAGIGLILAPINAYYRDVRFLLPYATQLLLFLTPVIYPVNFVGYPYRLLLILNPLSSIITAVRHNLLGIGTFDIPSFILSLFVSGGIFGVGIVLFIRGEKYIADIL